MKKRLLACLMCVLMVVGTVPAMPITDYFGIEAMAVNIESLSDAVALVPPEEWDKYIDTKDLEREYNMAIRVLKNPEGFDQEFIDECTALLIDAIGKLEYHTTGVTLNNSTYTAKVGDSFTLRAILAPDGRGADPVVWTSNNSDAVSVKNGVVTVNKHSVSPVTITATSNGYSADCVVTTLNPFGGVSISHGSIELFEGDRFTLTATAYGADSSALPTDKVSYSWKSSNKNVVSVSDNGVVTGVGAGECTVTVTATSGTSIYTATCTVKVNQTIPVTSLSTAELSTSKTITITAGENYTFNVLVVPTNATNKNLSWSCTDSSVLSISEVKTSAAGVASAKLTGLKAGTTEVTYVTTDGTNISGSFTVVVKPLITSLALVDEIKVLTLSTAGERFNTVIMPENAGNKTLSWKTSDKTVCEVDYNGVLYPRGIGVCTITATTQDGTGITVSGKVRVTEMASMVTVSRASLTLAVPATYKLSATVVNIDGSNYNDVKWTSGDPEIATVDKNGNVTARYPGVVVIKAEAMDGTEKYDTCILTVTQPLEGIELPATKSVYLGKSVTLKPTFIPEYASNKNVTWSSSDRSVATVDSDGIVTSKSVGTTTITCTSEDGSIKATCVVTVLIQTTGVSLNYTTAKIWKDDTVKLIPTITPEDATNKNVTWTSSDNSVALVDENGVVTGVAGGTCTITCTTENSSRTAKCTVTVLESVTGVAFASDKLSLYLGQTYTNKVNVIPSTATNQNVSWATNNDLIVRVSQNGELTAVGEGTAIVTVKTEDGGFVATCEVTVYSKVPVTGLTLDRSTLNLDVGEYYTFLATVLPSNASDTGITWRTDNSTVVAISQTGLIQAKSVGTAIVTATTDDGNFTQKCKVIVSQPVTGVRLNVASVTLAKGKQKSLIANVLPTNATNKEIIWESSDENVAVVSHTGLVTAVGAGNCTISATTVDGMFTATCDFSVYIPVTGITIGAEEIKIPKGDVRLLSASVYPSDATDRTIIWHSSNKTVATVNEVGQVTAKAKGTAIIYATSNDGGYIAQCIVQVVQLATSVTLNYASVTLDVGGTKQFTATLTPATVSDTTVKWSSSNKNVVTVSSKGLIKAVGPGTATITCKSGDGAVSTTCKITVTQPVTGITLDPASVNVKEGGLKAITATVLPANATDSKVHWLSSNPAIASVDADGIVYGHKPGTVTITAISNNNSEITATCKVTVVRSVTGIVLNKSSVNINVGASTTISVTYIPSDASIKKAKWTSSNYDVADVDSNGKITAKAPGYAVITAKSTDGGFTATCDVLCIQPVTGVSLSDKTVTLGVDEKYTLTANIKPSNASDKAVKWSSSDKSIVSVSSSGVLTGKDQGTATITCKTVDGSFKATCTVTVLKKVTGVTLNKTSGVLYLGKTLTLKPTVYPTDATDKTVRWYSGNKNVATVDKYGKVTPVSPGKVTIGVTTNEGEFRAYCSLEVRKAVESISLNKTSLTLYVDDTYQLKTTVLPDDATLKTVTWTVSDSRVLSVDANGKITAKASGTATITATAENGLKATCKVTVLQSVEGVALNTDSITLYTGEKEALVATVLPEGAHNQSVKWTSSNTSVAKVSTAGVVTGVKAGTAKITVTTAEGSFTASCTVVVKQHVTSIGFTQSELEIRKGNEADLTVTVLPSDATNKAYTIVSSDPQILFVDDDGHLVALKGGNVTVTVTAADNGKMGICQVTVVEPVTDVALEKDEDTVYVRDTFTIGAEVSPADATYKNLTWSSSDPSVASVNVDGVITVLKAGEAIITATTVDGGFTDSCVLTCLQKPETIEMEKEITIIRGESGKLNINVLPENSYDKSVIFESSNEQILRVDADGSFVTFAPGVVTITVTAVMSGVYSECTVNVIEPVTSIDIREKEVTVYKDTVYDFDAVIYPENATNQAVLWKVSNPAVAKIDSNGVLTALADGETYVTVTTLDGRYIDFCKVTIVLAVESITVENEEISLVEEESAAIIATVLPEKAYNKKLTFVSADESIATVDKNGVITAVSKGETYITVISVDNEEITATVKVTVIRVAEEIILGFDKEYLWNGETGNISVGFIPAEPNDESVTFTSSDETVATVDENGVVTALKAGEAVITVKTADGSVSSEITVEVRQHVEGIELSEIEKTVEVDDVFTLTATILPSDAYNKEVVWESSDEAILTVVDGEVTAHKTGVATITAKSAENGEILAECEVTVIRYIDSISFKEDIIKLEKNEVYFIEVTYFPVDATETELTWTSSDESVLTVDENGRVRTLKAGEAKLTVKTVRDEVFAECTVVVEVESESVALDVTQTELYCGDTVTLNATVLPEDATNKNIIWTTTDEDVLTVDENGVVTAVGKGTAKIIATTEDTGETAECEITVYKHVESVKMSSNNYTAYIGREFTLTASVYPADAHITDIIWKSSDSTVATVENGKVVPLRKGTAIISVQSVDGGYVDYCFVNVGIGIEAISFDKTEISIHKNESFTINVTVSPENATAKKLIWTSSDDEIATVTNGIVTAGNKSGTVTIKAVAADNSEAYAVCTVTVIEQVTGILLNEEEIQLMAGDSFTLVPVITPDNATYPEVEWKTSDENVAIVDENGVVTAVAPGNAIITCTNKDSLISAFCKVYVPVPVEYFSIELGSLSLSKGASSDLMLTAYPASHDESFTFASSDNTVLTVDSQSGRVTGVGAGTATVTAVSSLSGKTATVEITVIQPVEDIRFELSEYNGAYTGLTHQLKYNIYPADAGNKKVRFESSDEEIATVTADGTITYHKSGEVTIKVISLENGLYSECKVKVSQSPETIYINSSNKTLSVGDEHQFIVVITPIYADNQTVFWSSTAPDVVSVDQNGNIVALMSGTATITVTTWNGKTASCKVTVE